MAARRFLQPALPGDALLHMLPEAMDRGVSADRIGEAQAIGVLALVCIETLVRRFSAPGATAAFARMDIVGDFLHHLADGVVIGASFAIDATLGLALAAGTMIYLVCGDILPALRPSNEGDRGFIPPYQPRCDTAEMHATVCSRVRRACRAADTP